MTYPPQQPGPYDQNPYGQQQPGGYGPPSGGFPQQGGYPPPGGYQQQPGGYPPPQGGSPFGGYQQPDFSPPPKKKSPLPWILVGLAVIAIAAVLVTGLVAPGWMKSKDSNNAGGGGNKPQSAQQAAEAIVAAVNAKSVDQFRGYMCDPSSPATTYVPENYTDVKLLGPMTESGDTAKGYVSGKEKGKTFSKQELPLRKRDGKWCLYIPATSTSAKPSATG